MCLILDTNRFGDVLLTPRKPAYVPLLRWLTDPDSDGTVVIGGGKFGRELDKLEAKRFFRVLEQVGRARHVDDATVDAEERRLRKEKACASDDEHVVALARISGARVVCTEDHALWDDIGNKELLDHPRGRVYRTEDHDRLLHHDPGCQKPPSRKTAAKKTKRRRA